MTDVSENEAKEEDDDDEETTGNEISPSSPLTSQPPIFTISSPISNSTSINYPSPFEPPPDYDSWSATPSTTCSYCSSSTASTHFSRNRRSCCYYYPGPPPPRWDIIPENVEQQSHQSQMGHNRDIRWMRVSKNSFVIKRWALILLILVMLIMVSLLFGITLQHVQLLRSVAHLHKDEVSRAIQGKNSLRSILTNTPTESSVLKHRPIHHSFGRNTYSEKDWK